jgi:hypothetical protein
MSIFPGAVPTNAQLLVCLNNAETTLSAGIDDSTLTIPVADGTKVPVGGTISIDNEIIAIASVVGNTATASARGVQSTTPAAHSSAAPVRAYFTAGHHNGLRDEIIALADFLLNSTTIESFTAVTGADVVLAATPMATPAPMVFRGGILQTASADYTISGDTITFSTALIASERVTVRYWVA